MKNKIGRPVLVIPPERYKSEKAKAKTAKKKKDKLSKITYIQEGISKKGEIVKDVWKEKNQWGSWAEEKKKEKERRL